MQIELTSTLNDAIPVDVREISTSLMLDKSRTQVAKTIVHYGNRPIELGELFKLRGNPGDGQITWEGNLKHVHHIGYQMVRGELIVDGTAGNHLGREMSGGRITVLGDVGDLVGSEMRGGLIWVRGNAGDQLGGTCPGSKFGMNRGTILIGGNSGAAAGNAMRRGLIAIGGDAMSGLGANMLAGTIFVCGQCQPSVGSNMKRGTIVIGSNDRGSTELFSRINFRRAGISYPPMIGLIANWLEKADFSFEKERLLQQQFEQSAGDQVCGGRGEIFIPA